MRSTRKNFFTGMLIMTVLLCFAVTAVMSAAAEEVPAGYILVSETVEGPVGSYVCRPVLTGGDAAVCDAVNAAIGEGAILSEYTDALATLSPGSTGVRVSWRSNASPDGTCPEVLSILITADGKQPQDRPGQVNYAMTFDLSDGSPVTFDCLCMDEDGMEEFLDEYVWDELEAELSDYMSNCMLSPVPVDRFWLDGRGNIVFCYKRDRFSFLSGACGAFALRYDEAEEWLDTGDGSALSLALNDEIEPYALTLIGNDLKETLDKCRCPLDSFYYEGGSAYLTEEPLLRGVYLLTDENGKTVTGIMMLRGRMDGAVIGTTRLSEMDGGDFTPVTEEECRGLLTVPGCRCEEKKNDLIFTYFFDEDGVLYGIAVFGSAN